MRARPSSCCCPSWSAREVDAAGAEPERRPAGTESILIVDDEPAVAAFARRSLANLGYAVCVEHDVRAAIDHIDRCGSIDLLLSDVVLPDGIGTEVADAVREARPGTPTLFVCGYTADALADRGVRVDGLDMLEKPYTGVELATRVRRALDERRPDGRPRPRTRPPPRSFRAGTTRLHSGRDHAHERGQVAGDARRRVARPAVASPAVPADPVAPALQDVPRAVRWHRRVRAAAWFGPWEKNPQLCKACIGALTKQGPGGAEVELSLLFADIRGSTTIGERLRPTEFSALLHVFYRLAATAIADHEGIVDKFVGDEAIGLFIPGFAGADHAALAVEAGRDLLIAAGQASATRRPARSRSGRASTPAWPTSAASAPAGRSRTSRPWATSSTPPPGWPRSPAPGSC